MTEAQQTVDPATLDGFTGKRVTLTFNKDGEQVVQEGRVEMGAAIGLMFKEKGKSNVQLIEADSIVAVSELATREPKVTVKTLQPIAEGRVRQHLADRHGYTVEQANGLTEAQAKVEHDGIDHSTLAHKHEVPKAQEEAGDSPIASDDVLGEDGGAEPESDED